MRVDRNPADSVISVLHRGSSCYYSHWWSAQRSPWCAWANRAGDETDACGTSPVGESWWVAVPETSGSSPGSIDRSDNLASVSCSSPSCCGASPLRVGCVRLFRRDMDGVVLLKGGWRRRCGHLQWDESVVPPIHRPEQPVDIGVVWASFVLRCGECQWSSGHCTMSSGA